MEVVKVEVVKLEVLKVEVVKVKVVKVKVVKVKVVKVEVVKVEVVVNRGGGGEGGMDRGGDGAWAVTLVVKEVVMVEVKVVVLASEHCDCVIHSCNNNFFLLIQFVAKIY